LFSFGSIPKYLPLRRNKCFGGVPKYLNKLSPLIDDLEC
jgi:hypothetical protein